MDIRLGFPVLEAIVFGLVFAFLYYFMAGPRTPWPWWPWLALSAVLAGLAYLILSGPIHV